MSALRGPSPTPRELGFRMPAEWEPQEAMWFVWPRDPLTWPDRVANTLPPLDFSTLNKLEFEIPRYDDFPALNLARRAGETGGTLPAVRVGRSYRIREDDVDRYLAGQYTEAG